MNRTWMLLGLLIAHLVACAPISEDADQTTETQAAVRISPIPSPEILPGSTTIPASSRCPRNDDYLVAMIWEQWFSGFNSWASRRTQLGVTPPSSGHWTPFTLPFPVKLQDYIRQWGWSFPVKEVPNYMTAGNQFSVSHTVEMTVTGRENFVSNWRGESDGWVLSGITAGYPSEVRMGRNSRTVTAFRNYGFAGYDYDVNIYLTCVPAGSDPANRIWSGGYQPEVKSSSLVFGCVDPQQTIRIYRNECGWRCDNVVDCSSYRVPFLF